MSQIIYLLPTFFWIWMIWECIRYDPERNLWIWVLIFLNIPGAIIYFFVRQLPRMDFPVSQHLQRKLRRKELWQAEAAALNIANAYQYVNLGQLRQELGLLEKAKDAYLQALAKEDDNLQAMWGIVQIEKEANNHLVVKEYLARLLALKPDYEYGNADLLYIKTLIELNEKQNLSNLLAKNIKIWNKPEAYFLLAKVYLEENKIDLARETLQKMLLNLRSSPKFHYQKHRHLEKKAEKLLVRIKVGVEEKK